MGVGVGDGGVRDGIREVIREGPTLNPIPPTPPYPGRIEGLEAAAVKRSAN